MMDAATAAPREGALLAHFVLPDESGKDVDLEQFRDRRNLVLCFCRTLTDDGKGILGELADSAAAIAAEEGEVLAVVSGSPGDAKRVREDLGLPFPVLADAEGITLDRFCPGDVALYVTDRFREIFLVLHGQEACVPGQYVVDRLSFIERQCPE